MLHQAIPRKKAIVLLCFGGSYATFIALLSILMRPTQIAPSCSSPQDLFHKTPSIMFGLSVVLLVALVVVLQTATYWKLWKQQKMAVGAVGANTGRNRMYRRAMITSTLIATAFLIGWLPFSISILVFHWSNINEDTLAPAIRVGATLWLLQSFCNPIIFKLRNSNMEFRLWKRCLN